MAILKQQFGSITSTLGALQRQLTNLPSMDDGGCGRRDLDDASFCSTASSCVGIRSWCLEAARAPLQLKTARNSSQQYTLVLVHLHCQSYVDRAFSPNVGTRQRTEA